MLKVADRAQRGFSDASVCGSIIPQESIYALLAEHGERIVSDEDFAECYSDSRGRPSIPPSLLSKVMLLAYREGLSDERAMDALRFDLRWKFALDLPVDHPGFHSTSLVRFRARLLLHGKERLVSERSLCLATDLGLLDQSAEQIVDSTPMLGAAATQETVGIVRSGVRKLIDAVKAQYQAAGDRLEQGLRFDYARPREKPDGDWQDRKSRHALLHEVAEDAERALEAVEREPELAEEETVRGARELLREIVGQEFAVDADGVPKLRRPKDPGRVLTAHDPEIRHGRKTPAKRFAGFKLHAAATATKMPLLTALSVTPGSEHDSRQAVALVDQQPQERRPTRLLGDTAYGGGPVREELADREVEMLAPVRETSPRKVRSQRASSGSTSRRAPSPAPGARPPACSARTQRASGSRAFLAWRASPVRCAGVVHRAGSERSGSPARRSSDNAQMRLSESPGSPTTCARRECGSSACSASSSTATEPQEPLPRGPKSRAAGRVDRGARQSPPDRGRAAGRGDMTEDTGETPDRLVGVSADEDGEESLPRERGFLSGLVPKRDCVSVPSVDRE